MVLSKDFSFSRRFADVPVVGSAFEGNHDDLIPLSYGFPYPDSFAIKELDEAVTPALALNGTQALQYSGGPGQDEVRQWIRQRSRLRAINVETRNILVTTGSSQGMDLVTRTLTDPGDHVWVEGPTFFGALRVFRLGGAVLTSFPVDEHGLCVDKVEEALIDARKQKKPMPKFLYVLPNYQNPAGTVLSLERRKRLAELAYEYNFFIVEDDAYVELNFSGTFLPSIYSFGPERVIYLSTFSKIIAPGIRLAWAIADDEEVIEKMSVVKSDGKTSVFIQEVVSQFLSRLDFDAHLRKLVEGYRLRKDAMVKAIDDFFQSDVSFVEPEGGFFLWLTFPSGTDTTELLRVSYEEGVSFIDGRHFFLENEPNNHLRLSFSFCSEQEIRNGMKRIADAWSRLKKQTENEKV